MTPQEAIKHLTSIVNEIDDWRCDLGQVANEKEMNQIRAIWMAIEALQFQQELVRCKDCKYFSGASCKVNHDDYGFWLNVSAENYCSAGERRDEE